jgi:alpha-L-rhamnosidase
MSIINVYDLRCEYKKNPLGIDVMHPRFSWKIHSDKRGCMQSAYRLQVAIDDSYDDILWDTGKIITDKSIHVEYNGPILQSGKRYFYRIKVWDQKDNNSEWSENGFWEMGLTSPTDWKAKWITPHIDENKEYDPCSFLRKEFKAKAKIKSARVYMTSLGVYEFYLNGIRVSEDLFTPGWTSYNKRLQYQTYDITELLKLGNNTVGIVLGNGWYKGNLAWQDKKNIYGDKLAALFQMHITYEDASEELVLSDNTWKSFTGPILMSEIYHGEVYDARLERDNWSENGYNDSNCRNVDILNIDSKLVAQENVPVRKIEEIKPIEIFTTPKGEVVIDMGQNMVGWIRFKVKGDTGSKVILKHAEVLDKEGNFYTDNLRSAKQTIEYILKGKAEEVYEPHFSFQGFRYVKIVEYPGTPLLDNFIGVVIHSDMEPTGSFECSDELVNKLQHNILWGQKGNFLDVPTDCPQRDERLGWTGDAQVFIRTASFNMNTAAFFTKWLRDLKADQLSEGGVPFVVPHVLEENSYSSAAWGDAAVICPWTIYLCFADKRILEEQYTSMTSWVNYIRKQGKNEYLWNTGFHFGDWLGLDAKDGSYVGSTTKDFIATAFYAYSTKLVLKTAKLLNKDKDVKEYEDLYNEILKEFRKEFVTPNGRLAVATQTAHVLALMFDLLEEKDRKRTADTLVEYLKENKYHLTTGFVGTPYLCHVLSENGYTEIAYKLLLQSDYPSWLYQVTKGATTIWEHWDGIKEDGSFWSKDMNSYNHYAYGAIGDWLYRVVSGINIDEEKPGYKHTILKPQLGESFTYAKGELESNYGKIKSEWKKEGNYLNLKLVIAVNTTATLQLDFASIKQISEKGQNIDKVEGVLGTEDTIEGSIIQLGSGEYNFVINLDN